MPGLGYISGMTHTGNTPETDNPGLTASVIVTFAAALIGGAIFVVLQDWVAAPADVEGRIARALAIFAGFGAAGSLVSTGSHLAGPKSLGALAGKALTTVGTFAAALVTIFSVL